MSIFESFKPNLKALKKSTCWEITQEFCRVLEVITSVITAPYPFCFGFCVKFNYFCEVEELWKVAVLGQIFVLHCKNSWGSSVLRMEMYFSELVLQVVTQLSLVLHFFIWATEGFRKNQSLPAGLFWQISAIICICLLQKLLFWWVFSWSVYLKVYCFCLH